MNRIIVERLQSMSTSATELFKQRVYMYGENKLWISLRTRPEWQTWTWIAKINNDQQYHDIDTQRFMLTIGFHVKIEHYTPRLWSSWRFFSPSRGSLWTVFAIVWRWSIEKNARDNWDITSVRLLINIYTSHTVWFLVKQVLMYLYYNINTSVRLQHWVGIIFLVTQNRAWLLVLSPGSYQFKRGSR